MDNTIDVVIPSTPDACGKSSRRRSPTPSANRAKGLTDEEIDAELET